MKQYILILLVIFSIVFSLPQNEVTDTSCVLCELVVKEIYVIAKDNATSLVDAMKKVCAILPKTVKAQCEQFIKQYGQELIEILIEKLPPHAACIQLKLCSNKLLLNPAVIVKKVKNDNLCPICQMICSLCESYLATNATQEWIENMLHNFPCEAVLPPNLAKQCDNFVDQYVPVLIDWINNNESPKQFCSQAGLC